jgi:hypothetical protein
MIFCEYGKLASEERTFFLQNNKHMKLNTSLGEIDKNKNNPFSNFSNTFKASFLIAQGNRCQKSKFFKKTYVNKFKHHIWILKLLGT